MKLGHWLYDDARAHACFTETDGQTINVHIFIRVNFLGVGRRYGLRHNTNTGDNIIKPENLPALIGFHAIPISAKYDRVSRRTHTAYESRT